MIPLNWLGFWIARYKMKLMIPTITNPNNPHPIINLIGEILDHFLIITGGGVHGTGGTAHQTGVGDTGVAATCATGT